LALFYNQQLFDAAALPYPDASWQWADLQSAAAALTDIERGQFGLVLAADLSRWLAFLQQGGGHVFSPDGVTMAINSPEGAAALDFYTNLVLEGMATTPLALDSSWPGDAFGQGRAAMVVEGGWLIPHLAAEAPDVAYGVAPLPAGPAGKATISFGTCYAITALSPHQAAAQSLIDYLTAPEQVTRWIAIDSALPAQSSLQGAWRAAHPGQEALLEGVAVATEWQLPAGFQPWVAAVNDQLRRVFGGFIPASAVLPEAEQRGNELLPPQAGLATEISGTVGQ
jgi:multiple sugar transport system substrate-binding protein